MFKQRKYGRLAAGVLAMSLVVAACGDDGDSDGADDAQGSHGISWFWYELGRRPAVVSMVPPARRVRRGLRRRSWLVRGGRMGGCATSTSPSSVPARATP